MLCVGAAGGALNGFLVTRLGLPSIAVTIGTLTMFRGIAEIILGQSEVTGFPASLTKIGVTPILRGTKFSYTFGIFLVMAVIVRHRAPRDADRPLAVRDRAQPARQLSSRGSA